MKNNISSAGHYRDNLSQYFIIISFSLSFYQINFFPLVIDLSSIMENWNQDIDLSLFIPYAIQISIYQRPLLYVTDSQPITGSQPVTSQLLCMVTAKSSFMSMTRSYPAMAEIVFTVKFELPALINLF